MKSYRTISTVMLVTTCMLWSMAFSCASAIKALQTYVPIGLMAFDGAIDIISPVPGSPLQVDKMLADGTWASLSNAIDAYNAAPASQKQTVLADVRTALQASLVGVHKTLTDFGASGGADQAVTAALTLIVATLSILEAKLSPSSTPQAMFTVKVVSVNGTTIPISGKVSDFRTSYNRIMIAGGHSGSALR